MTELNLTVVVLGDGHLGHLLLVNLPSNLINNDSILPLLFCCVCCS